MNNLLSIWNTLVSALNFELLSLGNGHVTTGACLLALLLGGLAWLIVPFIKRWFIKTVLTKSGLERKTKQEALLIFRAGLIFIGVLVLVNVLGLADFFYTQLVSVQKQLSAVFDLRLFTLGKTQLTLWTSIYLIVLSWLLVRVTGQAERLLLTRIQSKTKIDRGLAETISTMMRYFIIFVGMVVIIQSAGIDLSALTIIAGAAGIAIGLGLQGIMNNLVSGLVILFERPIKVGDRIDVGGTTGDVAHLSMRATTIITNDDIAIIVPNSDFITSKVINWTYTGRRCQFKFPIRVSYQSDPKLVKELLLQAASEHKGVLPKPPPQVEFSEFGENSLNFALSVWTIDYVTSPSKLRSDLYFNIVEKFGQHKVPLPPPVSDTVEYPQVLDTRTQQSFSPQESSG